MRGRHLLVLLLGFASVPLHPVPAAFRGVSCRELPFGGSATFLAPYACPTPAVELCLWVFAVSFVRRLFLALCHALPLVPAVLRSSL